MRRSSPRKTYPRTPDSAQDLVGLARIKIVGPKQNPSANFAAVLAHQIPGGQNSLPARRSAQVENVARAFFAFVLNGVVKQAVQLSEDGNSRLSGEGGPATEHDRDLCPGQQLACLFSKRTPIGRGISDDRLQFLSEQPPFLFWSAISMSTVSLRTVDRHGARQRMQYPMDQRRNQFDTE